MFGNRKLEERVKRLERIIDGLPDGRMHHSCFGMVFDWEEPSPGLSDKVDAIAKGLGATFERVDAKKAEPVTWRATHEKRASARKKPNKANAGNQR